MEDITMKNINLFNNLRDFDLIIMGNNNLIPKVFD